MANKFIIEVRSKGFKNTSRDLDKVTTKTKAYTKSADKMRGTTAGLRRSIGALRNNLLLVSFAMGTVGFAIKKVVDAAAGFEAVKTRLVGLMGSVEAAERAFKRFNQVAATTPFTLQDVVEAGAQLKAFGADAEGLIKPVTDLAAFMGTTATEAANSLGRAFAGGAGAADILRERGILNLIKTTQGLDDLSKTTLPDFRKALIDTIQDPTAGIAGSTDRMSKTFIGAMSNMGDSVTRLAASIGDSFIPALISASQVVGNIADGLRRTNLRAYAAGFAAVTGAIALYNQAILTAKIRTIAFQATLAKTLWGAVIVGAGLVVGKMIELSGAMGEVNEATEEMEKRYERLRSMSWDEIMKVGGSEFTKRMQSAKETLRSVFAADESLIQSLALQVNKYGMDSEQVQGQIAILIEKGTLIRKDAGKAEAVLFAEFVNKQKEKLADMFEEFTLIEKLKQQYPELAEAMGFMDKKEEESPISLLNQDLEELNINILKVTNSLAFLEAEQKFLVNSTRQIASNFATAALNGQKMGDAVVSALKAISAQIIADMAIYALLNTFTGGVFGAGRSFLQFAFGHTGGLVKEDGVQKFAQGGMVQGQDNVPIMAQAGEFIMKRESVQNIGVDQLAQMNRTGSAGVTINVQGNMIGNESFVRDVLIPEISHAQRLNLA